MMNHIVKQGEGTDVSPDERELKARILPVSLLQSDGVDSMFDLYRSYYESTSRELFIGDLSEKDQVVLLQDDTGILRGFSTFKLFESHWGGQRVRVIFSGDTIIHHRYWGNQSLAFTWIRMAGSIKAAEPKTPLCWLLIVKGHRTYRYLQAFSRSYFPHWRDETPEAIQELMDFLGDELFAEHYQPKRGIVHFPVSRGHLRPEWAEPRTETLKRPEVQFFMQRNPGYRRGDELLCFTELNAENLRPLARRLFQAGFQG